MRNDAAIRFEPVTPEHYPLLRRWLDTPHWRAWWGEPETEFGYIRDMVEGRDTTRPFIFFVDDEPTGYIQCWFIGPHQTEEWIVPYPWLKELPAEAVGVDLSIGSSEQLSRGIGSRVLTAFVEKLRSEGHAFIVIDPDPANRRAVRAYEKAGFRPIPWLLGKSGDSFLMLHHVTLNERHS